MSDAFIGARFPAWLVLSFGEERQYGGNVGYEDEAETVYRYDNFVPNCKQVKRGDLFVIATRAGLIGFARIREINTHPGQKKRFRCPHCHTSAIKKRKRAKTLFRCSSGHEFHTPVTEEVDCTVYEAHYEGNFVPAIRGIAMPVLRRACPRYSDQLAIQRLDFPRIESEAFASAPELQRVLQAASASVNEIDDSLDSVDARPNRDTAKIMGKLIRSREHDWPKWEFDPANVGDARERVAREILKRRGQPAFRRKLLKIYGNRCSITGCNAVEVLEACHIVPYLGPKTNHPSNGLVLRADLHTLFDLGLITIDVQHMTVKIAACLLQTDYARLRGVSLRPPETARYAPNRAALEQHRKCAEGTINC